jgi:hypothetical protein
LRDLDLLDGESATVDFKESLDPGSKQDWCELIKDIVAMTNSGDGCIVIGLVLWRVAMSSGVASRKLNEQGFREAKSEVRSVRTSDYTHASHVRLYHSFN